jgi:SAM-dependent methyltransferase
MTTFNQHKIVWTGEKVERLWNYYASSPRYAGIYFSKVHGAEILRRSRLPLGRELSLLDFGCGTGHMWDHVLARTSWRYTGLDFSPGSVAQLDARASGQARYAGALHTERLPSPLPEAAFDVAVLIEVIEHLDDDALHASLSELARVLKKGGAVIITTPNDENLEDLTKFCPECGCVFHEWQHVRSWTADSLTAAVAPYGFGPLRVEQLTLGSAFQKLVAGMRRLLRRPNTKPPHLVAVYERR